MLAHQDYGITANFQSLLWAIFSYLKTVWFAFLAGTAPAPSALTKTGHCEEWKGQSSTNSDDVLARIKEIEGDNETAALLQNMIDTDGAGSWPPQSSSDIASWPAALRSYHEIYLELVPRLSVPEPSLDDEVNNKLRSQFRERMRKLLTERVDLPAVEALLAAVEAGNQSAIPKAVYNRFLACVAMSRHAFRWATIPAVKVAQVEKLIDYPPALVLPWPFFCRHYGFYSLAGNAMTNFVYNWEDGHGIVYKINEGRSDEIMKAEYWFTYMFIETERLAVPVYLEIVRCLAQHRRGDRAAVLASLGRLNAHVRAVMKVFYENLVSTKIAREVWMPYVQGFHAYGAGEMRASDGAYVESDGVSGNQLPFFHVVDAFLGLGTYLTVDEMSRSVPLAQRRFSYEVRRQSFRKEVKEAGDTEVEELMAGIAKQLRVWRAAHRVRIVPYINRPSPERLLMMAGKSVLETKGVRSVKAAVEYVDSLIYRRVEETK